MNQENPTPVCEMTPEGMREAQEYLSILREGKRLRNWRKDLDELLSDPSNAQPITPEVFVQKRLFASRREAGEYLQPILAPLGVDRIAGNKALWSWLGMFYMEQASASDSTGNPKPSASDEAYILDPQKDAIGTSGYRHRLMVAYEIYVRHGEKAWCMLDQPLRNMERFTVRLFGAPTYFNAVGIVELAHLLYVDPKTRHYKPDISGTGSRGVSHNPGTLPRLISVLNQLYMTYDVYGMTAQQLLNLLPPEFDRWKPAEPTTTD